MFSFLIIIFALAAFIAVSFGAVYILNCVFNPGNQIDLGAPARAIKEREEFYQQQQANLIRSREQAALMRKYSQDFKDMETHKRLMELAAYKQQHPCAFKN